MEKIFQMLQSTDSEIVLLAVTSLKNTRFYKENMGEIVIFNYIYIKFT